MLYNIIKVMSFSVVLFLTGCSSKQEGREKILCGGNSSHIQWQVTSPKSETNRFAIMLNGSPVTNYFSDQSPNSAQLVTKLVERGFKVFEVKYPFDNGFYAACYSQGVDKITEHCADVYEIAAKHLGFNSNDPKHKVIGVGWSIGAIQLQAMSFIKGRRIDKIALAGVLLGDVEQGCKSFLENKNDGYSWAAFHSLAQAVTSNGTGCHPNSEFTSDLNFEKQKYFDKWSLGIFEGELTTNSRSNIAGNIAQARYIAQKRKLAGAPVELYSYPNCGHELLECTRGKAVDDILAFVDNI